MNKKRLIAIGLILAIATWIYLNFLSTDPPMSRQKAAYRMTAVELYQAFENDEDAANKLYQNQVIEIVGLVEGVEFENGSKPVISLATEGFGSIKVTLAENAEPVELNKFLDDEIRMKGECIGLLLDVLLVNSIILED